MYIAHASSPLTNMDTRYNSDPVRIRAKNEYQTFAGRYQLEAPGPGADAPFQEDPNIRMQHWGANSVYNGVQVESDLLCLGPGRRLSHLPESYKTSSEAMYESPASGDTRTGTRHTFGSAQTFTEESRASDPAFVYRSAAARTDLDLIRGGTPMFSGAVFRDASQQQLPLEYSRQSRFRQ